MAEIETIDQLRTSLAERRTQADERLQALRDAPALPSVDEVLESRPVRFMIEHPALIGLAAGVVYLFGPARLLKAATAGIGLVHSLRALRAAQDLLVHERHDEGRVG